MDQPTREHVATFTVRGLVVRTTNPIEADPQQARIGPLWGRFFGENLMGTTPDRSADPRNFGVYSNFESDSTGAFDVTAGVAVNQGGTVTIEAGDYLVFPANGTLPQSIVGAWQHVWQYFAANPQVRRRYRTDFEAYQSPTEAAIYIGVE